MGAATDVPTQPPRFVRDLLFDFGGPLLLTPFELRPAAAASMGVDAAAFSRGPFDPADERWKARDRGEITERGYWTEESARFELDIVGYMHHFYDPPGDHLVRPEGCELIDVVHAAGRRVGLLTNDLRAFHGPGWHEHISVLSRFDPLVDLSTTGYLKPHPRAYAEAIAAMRAEAHEIVFVDDQIDNVDAARVAGLVAVWFDVTDPAGSFALTRAALEGSDPT